MATVELLARAENFGAEPPTGSMGRFKDWPVCGDGGTLGWAGESQRGKGPSG